MDNRAPEDDVIGKEGYSGIQVAAFNRIAELLHLDLLGVRLQVVRCRL